MTKLTNTTLADERKIQVQELLTQGLSQSEIAKQLGIDRSAVHYIIKRATQQGLQPIEAITTRANTPEIQLICQILKQKQYTQAQLAKELNKSASIVYKWVSGDKKPGKETVAKLQALLAESA